MRAVLSERLLIDIPAFEHRHDRQTEDSSEFVVTFVVRRHRHDRASAVTSQNIIRNEDGHLLTVDRVRGIGAQENAGLFLILLPFHVRLRRDRALVRVHSSLRRSCAKGPTLIDVRLVPLGHQLLYELVLRRENHVGRAKQGVRTRGEHVDGVLVAVGALSLERHLRAAGTADPIPLHRLDLVRPIQQVEVVEQAVRVGGDAHHPLAQTLTEDRVVPALRTAFGSDLFVGQHSAQSRAPVDH